MSKFATVLISLVVGGLLVAAGFISFSLGKQSRQSLPSPTPLPVVSLPVASPEPSSSATVGSISGKLCYPSEFLPSGKIVVKDTETTKTHTQNYPGTEGGAGSTYTIEVPAGTYVVRYEALTNAQAGTYSYGYHTTVCPTGMETTCSDANKRQLLEATVSVGSEVTGYDLCDFYHTDANAPDF